MKKTLFAVIVLLLSAAGVSAQSGKLSPYTRIYLEQHKTEVQQQRAKAAAGKNVGGSVRDSIDTFLKLNDGCDATEIEQQGVRVVNHFGQLLTVRIALGDVERVATLPSVKDIDMGAPVHLCNDSARIASKVNILHSGGGGLGQQYTGKGVIVGVVDLGIEYNHINFKDAKGKSRVKMVYDALNDKTYLDPDDIAALTTDDSTDYHGTHVAGIAAGSYTKNGYQGMAPEADLVLCGQGESLSEAGLINSFKKIFDYADLVGKPASVNFSMGDNSGAHDGTDFFNQAVESLKAPGHIISMAAGNAGEEMMYIKHKSENADDSLQFYTCMYPNQGYSALIDLWSKSSTPFSIRIGIMNLNSCQIEALMPMLPDSLVKSGKSYSYPDTLSIPNLPAVPFMIQGELNSRNNRYKSFLSFEMAAEKANQFFSDHCLVMMVYSKKGETIEAWSNNASYAFDSLGLSDNIAGNDSCSVNSWVYNTNNICVGAYVTKNLINSKLRKPFIFKKRGEKGDIASFSSYGIKDDGTVLPDVVAPGSQLVSSYNYAARQTSDSMYIADSINANGRTYYWGYMQGTSMSCPVVTGIIATWLQCKPTLTVEEIKDILDNTAVSDYYVKKYNYVKSGRGKIDAFGGLKYLLTTNIGNPECAQNQVLIYPSADGKVNIYAQGETGDIRVGVYAANGMRMFSRTIATTDGSATIDIGGNLPQGLYIIKVEGKKASGSNTLSIR